MTACDICGSTKHNTLHLVNHDKRGLVKVCTFCLEDPNIKTPRKGASPTRADRMHKIEVLLRRAASEANALKALATEDDKRFEAKAFEELEDKIFDTVGTLFHVGEIIGPESP